jgi:hypothetical protein
MVVPRRRSATGATLALVLVLLAAATPRGQAQRMDTPAGLQFPLLLKILQFDRNLAARAGDEVVIGIVYQGTFRTALGVKKEIEKAADQMGQPRVLNLPVRVVGVDVEKTNLVAAIDSLHIDVVYVAPLRGMDISAIKNLTRRRKITSVTGVEEYVRGGLSVGVGVARQKPCIVVNLEASRAEGADFSSRLLHLAKLVE